ncbi:MAG TPA: calcium-binding protein, partial [Myxococcota bacterium]
ITKIETKDFSLGGADTISGAAGHDTAIGGSYNDSITGSTGDDVLIGDNARMTFAAGKVLKIETTDTAGNTTPTGRDTISGNEGDDTILGGADADSLFGNANNDVILGDNGVLDYQLVGQTPKLTQLSTTDTDFGGSDTVQGNEGDDIVLGGAFGDVLNGNEASDIVLGDNGQLLWTLASAINITAPDGWTGSVPLTTVPAALLVIRSYAPLHGGNDTIMGDAGNDTLLGGTGSDTISGDTGLTAENGSGHDVIFGDHGVLYPTLPANRNAFSKDTGTGAAGAADRIHGNGGDDTVIAGQGDDTVLGGDGHDAIIGGHNIAGDTRIDTLANAATGAANAQNTDAIVKGSSDTGDHLDGGRGFDVIAGDNAWMIPVVNGDTQSADYSTDRLFRTLNSDGLLYDDPVNGLFAANLTAAANPEPGKPGALSARAVFLLDHTKTTDASRFGADTIAGGADNDTVFGQLGNDSLHGDGRLDSADAFNLKNAFTPDGVSDRDGNDYVEGNGGSDTIFGGRGQDNLLGGSSDLFGLAAAALRPDSFDLIYGGNATETGMNDYGDAAARTGDVFLQDDENVAANGHARDADVVLGDNGRVFRILSGGNYASFAYDGGLVATGGSKQPVNATTLGYNNPSGYGTEKIQVRAFELIDYTPGVGGVGGNFGDDRIFGEAGDDTIHGMAGSDSLFGDGQDDDLYGGTGHDWIHGGTGEDGVVGDDGLIKTSRNGLAEPLYGLAAIPAAELNLFIKTPGSIQQSTIN